MKVKRNSPKCRWLRLSLLAALLGLGAGGVRAQRFAITDLGTLGGPGSRAYGMNQQGDVVGTSITADGQERAFLLSRGHMMDLGTLGGTNSQAFSVNDHGWIVGAAELTNGVQHAFLCTNTETGWTMMDLGTLGGSNSMAHYVNDNGDIVGWADGTDGVPRAFAMTNVMGGMMMDLSADTWTNSAAYCLNNNGFLVGDMDADDEHHAIFSTNAMMGAGSMMMMNMGMFGGASRHAYFVNDDDDVVGTAQYKDGRYQAYLVDQGGMMGTSFRNLGTLGGMNSEAYCLNNSGYVVGAAETAAGEPHAFLWQRQMMGMGTMWDLNDLIPGESGWELTEARFINDGMQIVGTGMYHGETHAFLLTPVTGSVEVTQTPEDQTLSSGGQTRLHFALESAEPMMIQWMRDGVPIPGATNNTLILTNVDFNHAGRYHALVENEIGMVANPDALIGVFGMGRTNALPMLMLAGPQGYRYEVETLPDLQQPHAWQPLTNVVMGDSLFRWVDEQARTNSMRFYRARPAP